MSREWKEPNATRQNPNDLSWDDLPQEDAPPFSYEEDEVATISNPPAMPPEDFAMDESLEPEPEPFITRSEALRNFGQQISPILVPLLFGGLTFLFILPLAQTTFTGRLASSAASSSFSSLVALRSLGLFLPLSSLSCS